MLKMIQVYTNWCTIINVTKLFRVIPLQVIWVNDLLNNFILSKCQVPHTYAKLNVVNLLLLL